MSKKVYIGVGHGGSDPGAVGSGFKEKDLNLSIANACAAALERHGVAVKMSRTADIETTVAQDINGCNTFDPDLAVDIHNNAGGGDGAEVFYHHGGGTGKTLAVNILNEVAAIGQNSRGAKTRTNDSGKDYYYFIREIAAPSVIVECAFVDNATDIQIVDTEAERNKMGVAIARGILKTLGIEWTEQAASNEFNNLDEVPGYARSTIEKLLNRDLLVGTGKGLQLSEDMLRVLVINDRAGLYD